jgi:hypothetical protein
LWSLHLPFVLDPIHFTSGHVTLTTEGQGLSFNLATFNPFVPSNALVEIVKLLGRLLAYQPPIHLDNGCRYAFSAPVSCHLHPLPKKDNRKISYKKLPFC